MIVTPSTESEAHEIYKPKWAKDRDKKRYEKYEDNGDRVATPTSRFQNLK